MLKTELFYDTMGSDAIHDYREFVNNNQTIEIINVLVTQRNHIVLTYKTKVEEL